jgi:tRNA(Ile)-lysidine synthase
LLQQLLKPITEQIPAFGLTLPHSSLANMPKALRIRLYKSKLETLGPGQPLLRSLLALDKAWEQRKTGAEIQFPGRKKARLQHGKIIFSRDNPANGQGHMAPL